MPDHPGRRPVRKPRRNEIARAYNVERAISEEEWQRQVIELAELLGWQHMHVRRSIGRGGRWTTTTSVKGFPDLLLWHERQHRVIAAELKTERGVLSPEQNEVLLSLRTAGVETYVWRPSQLVAVQDTLARPRKAA